MHVYSSPYSSAALRRYVSSSTRFGVRSCDQSFGRIHQRCQSLQGTTGRSDQTMGYSPGVLYSQLRVFSNGCLQYTPWWHGLHIVRIRPATASRFRVRSRRGGMDMGRGRSTAQHRFGVRRRALSIQWEQDAQGKDGWSDASNPARSCCLRGPFTGRVHRVQIDVPRRLSTK